jgi:hypothetical protein
MATTAVLSSVHVQLKGVALAIARREASEV